MARGGVIINFFIFVLSNWVDGGVIYCFGEVEGGYVFLVF